MPSFPCKHGTCINYVAKRGEYCPAHAQSGKQERAERDRFYDRHQRDPDARKFYASPAWLAARRIKLAHNPTCERCEQVFAQHVHHRIPLKRCRPEQRTSQRNLMAVCAACHNQIEKENTACSSR
jgi:5-methylcytosine-specific restriction protein A